jgi:phytanoyl-CoA hydroxylase
MTTSLAAGIHPPTLSAAAWAEFDARGLLRLGRVIDDATLAGLGRRIDQIMLGEVRYPDLTMQLDSASGNYSDMPEMSRTFKGATLAYRKIEGLEVDPLFRDYLQSPLNRHICQRLVGPDIAIYRSMFMNKPARQGTLLPWHQDGGTGWNLDIDPIITLWLALDPATIANGCVQVIPGSHRLGLLSERGHVLSDEHVRQHCPPERIEYVELAAGEAVLLHNFLLHRSDRNATDIPRRAFSVCLMDAATRHRDRPEQAFPLLFGQPR